MEDRTGENQPKLKKELGFWDVYCVATGAMISSGFFLLPGLATAISGPSTVLAYLFAGILMIPSMLSMLELATALPRAGGAYFFLDRSMGPAVGTVTGIGIWLSLVLKSAFALVGMGAYLMIVPGIAPFFGEGGELAITVLAVVLSAAFVLLNIMGAEESTRLQKILVAILLAVLGYFLLEGFWHVFVRQPPGELVRQYTPFLHAENGWGGLLSTVGLVFVSFAGLTQVASISEEVRRPERNLPLGVSLALATATAVYVGGVFVMIAVLDPGELRRDYTPVATAATSLARWLPEFSVLILVVLAALAAFASTGNAGILAASRYPLAMARDRIVPRGLERLGRFHTPTRSILLTGAAIAFFIVAFSAEGVAKLGSTINLMVFALLNIAVIVMRESRVEGYDPGYRLPFYPWMPLAGIFISAVLIAEMGRTAIGFSMATILAGFGWYLYYAKPRVRRTGAIHHVFARLGKRSDPDLLGEFREIIKEKGLREDDPFDVIVHRADIVDLEAGQSFDEMVRKAAERLAKRLYLAPDDVVRRLVGTGRYGGAPISTGVAILHFQSRLVESPEMTIVRSEGGLCVSLPPDDSAQPIQESCDVFALFILVSPEKHTGRHLRILAHLARRAENPAFVEAWRRVRNPVKLKEILLRDEKFLELFVGGDPATESLVDARISDADLPSEVRVALIRRDGELMEPGSDTRLRQDDYLTLVGEPEAIEEAYRKFVETDPET